LVNELGPPINVAKYLVSEKYDSVLAIWDGEALRLRSGSLVNAAAWFIGKCGPMPQTRTSYYN
jgi:DNA ligase